MQSMMKLEDEVRVEGEKPLDMDDIKRELKAKNLQIDKQM